MSEDKADYNPMDAMMNLKGKAYLPVAARIVWFRQDYPEGSIETFHEAIDLERGYARYRAEVCTGLGGRATATGSETAADFGDYVEKAETKAVGRALGYLGYGTAAAGFEEGKRVVDAPQPPRRAEAARPAPAATTQPAPAQRQPAALAPNQVAIPCADCRHAPSCRTEGYCQRAAVAVSDAQQRAPKPPPPPGPGCNQDDLARSVRQAWVDFLGGKSAKDAQAPLRLLWLAGTLRDRDFIEAENARMNAEDEDRARAIAERAAQPAPAAPTLAGGAG